ncbi:MAG TPA: hypothetical protein V6C52_04400 [Coleofasciculaceae cyanobacterium]|jgi:hypothetical protein
MSAYGATFNNSSLNRNGLFNHFLNSALASRPTQRITPIGDRYQSHSYQPYAEPFEQPKKMGFLKKAFLLLAGLWLGKKVLNHLPAFSGRNETRDGEDLNELA